MTKYRNKKSEYNLEKHIQNKSILNQIIDALKDDNLNKDEIADLINVLADFLQYNEVYTSIESFNLIVNKTVEIIETFDEVNENNLDIIKEVVNLIDSFKNYLEKNIDVKFYFYGNDKYNLLKKSTIKDINQIKNHKDLMNLSTVQNNNDIKVLILSEETTELCAEDKIYFNDIVYYDKLMNHMFNISEKIYYSNYDYNYLIKALEKSKSSEINAIIVGNSYPLTGIETKLLECSAVNLSLSSQDLYYSYKLAKEAILNNKNIKKCIIGAGYYLVNHDLSKGKNSYSTNMVKNVYYPILKDKHNSENVEKINILKIEDFLNDVVINQIFNLDYLDYYFKDLIYRDNNGYYNNNLTRTMNSALRGVSLSKISCDEKMRLGKIRAEQHNKLSKYDETTLEYKKIFDEFIQFLNENNIEITIVIFPTTEYYNKFLNKDYEHKFYNIINNLENKFDINVVDFSFDNMFSEDDFIDFDHMSENGAKKITLLLNKILVNESKFI